MSHPIFRQEALEQLENPEQLNELIQVTHLQTWLALLSLSIFMSLVGLWLFWGEVQNSLDYAAIFTLNPSLFYIEAPHEGVLSQFETIAPNDRIQAGQTLAQLSSATGNMDLVSPVAGQIRSIYAYEGLRVSQGTALFSIDVSADSPTNPLQVVFFASFEDSQVLREGLKVWILPANAKIETHGYLLGTIRSIAPHPSLAPDRQAQFGNSPLLSLLESQDLLFEVRVDLLVDEAQNYRWTINHSDTPSIVSGSLASVTIELNSQRPIDFLLGH